MDNFKFARGIKDGNFYKQIKCACEDEKSWLYKLISNQNSYLAFRDNYLNIYMNGCSIVKIKFVNQQMVGQTHYKYLLQHRNKDLYISSANGELAENIDFSRYFSHNFNNLKSFKYWSSIYCTLEDKGIFKIIKQNPNILDFQITFGSDSDNVEEKNKCTRVLPRLDFCALQKSKKFNGYNLVFFEAKLFSSNEIRSNGDGIRVVRQIKDYSEALEKHKEEIVNSYKTVCKNFADLPLDLPIKNIATEANESELRVCCHPILVVFGFDQDQKDGEVWSGHRSRLQEALNGRMLLRGNPDGLTRGISSSFLDD